MCGIAGILEPRAGGPRSLEELRAMVTPLHHRGPDESGVHQDDQIGLGHARLSIIDLSGGKQPLHNEDRSVWVTFNGEIFNYKELQPELARRGHTFATSSDTEVIVHAYEEYGLDFVHHLNGQFAIALWDARRRRLVLARDRVGIRPLFYTWLGQRLLFASEVKSLFAVPGVPRQLDHRALGEAMTFWAPVAPRTPFTGILALPPGHLMVVEGGKANVSRYWDWSFPKADAHGSPDLALERHIEELRALLIDAVRLQLRADVPVGAYLSGGLDSSVLTATIKHFTDTPLRTFSIGFEDAEFDERPFQDELVAHLGTTHTAFSCRRSDIGRAFPKAVWHAEAPLLRTAPTPLMLLSQHVREAGFKVVLTGEGADEVFAGYDIFKEAQVRRFCARQPESRNRPRLLSRLYPYLASSPAAAPAFAESFFKQGSHDLHDPAFGHRPRWSTARRTWRFFTPGLAQELASFDPAAELVARLPAELPSWEPLNRDQYIEAHTLLSSYLLSSQGDRMGMANSIEGRFPYLDHRVIELGNRLPPLCKLLGLREKHILKRAMADLLPASITRRPKQPYRAPDAASFFVDGKPLPYVGDLLSPDRLKKTGLFDAEATGKLLQKCAAGRAIGFADNMAFVGILSTMLIDETLIAGHALPA